MKADKDSANLAKLQQASRGVNQATAGVVASTKSGKSQIEEKGEHGAAGLAGSTDLPPDLHSLRSRCSVGPIHVHGGFCLQHRSCWGGQVTLGSSPQGDMVFLSLQTAWTSLA